MYAVSVTRCKTLRPAHLDHAAARAVQPSTQLRRLAGHRFGDRNAAVLGLHVLETEACGVAIVNVILSN